MSDLIARRKSDGLYFQKFDCGTPRWGPNKDTAKIVDEANGSLVLIVLERHAPFDLVDTDFI